MKTFVPQNKEEKYMNIKIYNNKKLQYLELRHVKRDECKRIKYMNNTLKFV